MKNQLTPGGWADTVTATSFLPKNTSPDYVRFVGCAALSHSVTSNSLQPHGLPPPQAPLSMGILQARTHPPPEHLPNPRIKSRCPTLHVYSLPAESQGKPKNTGVGSLSLLQGIFLTQESSQGLLHCRQILYQLSYWEMLVYGRYLG